LVRDKLPNTLEVLLDDEHRPRPGQGSAGGHGSGGPSRIGRSPVQLFGDYLAEQNVADPRLNAMFASLLDELTGAADGAEEAEPVPGAR
jgi:exonuclease SbcD